VSGKGLFPPPLHGVFGASEALFSPFARGVGILGMGKGYPTFSATGNMFFFFLSSKYTHEIYETKVGALH